MTTAGRDAVSPDVTFTACPAENSPAFGMNLANAPANSTREPGREDSVVSDPEAVGAVSLATPGSFSGACSSPPFCPLE